MPPGPVLPTLSLWAQSHITALFKATTTQEFDDAFDAFLAHHVDSIVVNGDKLTKDQYKNRLQSARALEQSAEVKYLGTVEVQDAKEGVKAGEVGLFLEAEIFEKIFIFGAPASRKVTISFNLKIVQDKSIPPPHGPVDFFDPRRVSSLTSVFTSARDPIVPPHGTQPPVPTTSTGGN